MYSLLVTLNMINKERKMSQENPLSNNIPPQDLIDELGLPLNKIVVIMGTPILTSVKINKFKNVFDVLLTKLVENKMIESKEINVIIPLNESGGNDGYILLSPKDDRFKIDKLKTFFESYQFDTHHKFQSDYLINYLMNLDVSKITLRGEETENAFDHIFNVVNKLSFVRANKEDMNEPKRKTITEGTQQSISLNSVFNSMIRIKNSDEKNFFDRFSANQYVNSDPFFDNFSTQFVVQINNSTEINWFSPKDNLSETNLVIKQDRWTENLIGWTPRGTFFYTTHSQGVKIWTEPDSYYDDDETQNVDITSNKKKKLVSCR